MTDLYKQSGVDVEKGDKLVNWLQSSGTAIGGFAGLYPLTDISSYKSPALISCTDGVGTKILLALEHAGKNGPGCLQGLGQDLVAMVLNDMVVLGAKPLFFLDYYATGVLDDEQFKHVLTGIKSALEKADCKLMGGETAELPGLYEKGHFDLAGFGVGIVDQSDVLGPERVQSKDTLITVPSSGFHANGYSLLRSWRNSWGEEQKQAWDPKLLTPTKVYAGLYRHLTEQNGVHAISHITGGGIWGNLKRVLPQNSSVTISPEQIRTPQWMQDVIASGGASFAEAEKVFNMGIGLILVCNPAKADKLVELLVELGHEAYPVGNVELGSGEQQSIRWQS